jgi:hypothetical protein
MTNYNSAKTNNHAGLSDWFAHQDFFWADERLPTLIFLWDKEFPGRGETHLRNAKEIRWILFAEKILSDF